MTHFVPPDEAITGLGHPIRVHLPNGDTCTLDDFGFGVDVRADHEELHYTRNNRTAVYSVSDGYKFEVLPLAAAT